MSKIIDDLGYRIKIPNEELLAITLVDNGVDPYKKMKKTTLQHKVVNEYDQLQKINWKKLDNLYKQILQVGRTKKISFPKSKKTKRKRRKLRK